MKSVAKLVIVHPDNKYLLLYRNNHPTFGSDPDVPGGTLEKGETLVQTMLREVEEEAGVVINENDMRKVYVGSDYSTHGAEYGHG